MEPSAIVRFSRQEVMFLVGVPLAWGVLLLFHPGGDPGEIYVTLQDKVTRWMVVHIGMMVFIPMMAVAVYLLLRGVEGTAARVSRIALAPFVVFYSAWEVLQGIANGILVDQVNALPEAERAAGAALVQDFAENAFVRDLGVFGSIGSVALITAATAAGVALARPFRVPDHRPSAALRTHRPGPLHRRRPALHEKPVGNPTSGVSVT